MVRNGHDYKGAQKYHCHDCQSYGTLQAQRGYDERTRSQVKRAVLERISLRGVERLYGLSAAYCGSIDCRPGGATAAAGNNLG